MIQPNGIQKLYTSKMKLSEIPIRDPFILPMETEKRYYLYGTTDTDPWFGAGEGFRVWWSENLEDWEGGNYAFIPPIGFWADKNFWAPEVHIYNNAYYMFATFHGKSWGRGVQILKSELPYGPYVPLTDGPITPKQWECLDGTLYMEDGVPWLIFSHEWTQIHDGTICCARLSDDLCHLESEPVVLFHGSQAPWSVSGTGDVITMSGENYVTDGAFLFHPNNTKSLQMLWSSYSESGYAMGIAHSETGSIQGPWSQSEKPYFEKNGGHGMLFKTFEGKLKLAIHTPNESPFERVSLIDVDLIQ